MNDIKSTYFEEQQEKNRLAQSGRLAGFKVHPIAGKNDAAFLEWVDKCRYVAHEGKCADENRDAVAVETHPTSSEGQTFVLPKEIAERMSAFAIGELIKAICAIGYVSLHYKTIKENEQCVN